MQSIRNLLKIVYIKIVTQCSKISRVQVIILRFFFLLLLFPPVSSWQGKNIFVSGSSQILREKINTFVANLKGLISTFVFLYFKDTPPPRHTTSPRRRRRAKQPAVEHAARAGLAPPELTVASLHPIRGDRTAALSVSSPLSGARRCGAELVLSIQKDTPTRLYPLRKVS